MTDKDIASDTLCRLYSTYAIDHQRALRAPRLIDTSSQTSSDLPLPSSEQVTELLLRAGVSPAAVLVVRKHVQ